ncbi:MgtE-domain-containing protein [Hesseltinella vesiculosa]|uniref:MgtE-domain-containing protein n=1 Tax=Hesseltinella vesiculosa TaxID=101127 RepID=A0A1X2GG71_9FUNG|nr:MgtE-domain-containing protein [Hesseltinella vesiculosa]
MSHFTTKNDYIELSPALNEDDEPPDIRRDQYSLEGKRSASIHRASMEALLEEATHLEPNPASHPWRLIVQSLPSLIISLIGLVVAGVLMDEYQHWQVFVNTSELFILLPILLNLKGNLEMILASRFSTSANMGELDYGSSRKSLMLGNLALLQVQALVAGAIAGLASFALGVLTRPDTGGSYYESVYMTACSMVSASFSSAILGVFMCALILICRQYRINPDNIACPLASATGDVVTLILLAGCAMILQDHMETLMSTFVFLSMLLAVPFFGVIVWRNKRIKQLLFAGWTPIVIAMVISSLAGVVLEHYVEKYKGIALLTPVLIGVAGNLGSIYVSRISTCLHQDTEEDYASVERALFLMNIPVQAIFLLIIWAFNMGDLDYNFWFFLTYMMVNLICTFICLKVGKWMTLSFWKMGYDPDNYVIPYLTATIDAIGTVLLVATFSLLTSSGASNMQMPAQPTN